MASELQDLVRDLEVSLVATVARLEQAETTRAGEVSAVRTLGGHRRFRAAEIRRHLEEVPGAGV